MKQNITYYTAFKGKNQRGLQRSKASDSKHIALARSATNDAHVPE